ncbi:hypothetical protein BB561_003208 [Smittium simulii]|uniref:Nucleoside transporter n=1 Tax=Smittium simulii TaxID=133385 RepID=A0A2T9YMG8_9FUNG|nr:hypothetical protein BB561_003208 [Smittium simulii]
MTALKNPISESPQTSYTGSPDLRSTLLDPNSSISKPNYSNKIYYTMLFAGFSNLLGWNAFITAFPLFEVLLVGSNFETSYGNFFSFFYTFGGLIALTYTLATQNKLNYEKRIYTGFVINAVTFFLFAILPYFSFIRKNLAFYIILILDLILTFSGSYTQSPLFAFTARLSPVYLQGMMTGQAVAGIFSSAFQLIVAHLTSINSSSSSTGKILTSGLKLRTLLCFSVSGLLILLSIYFLIALKKNPSYIKEIEYYNYQASLYSCDIDEQEESSTRPKNWKDHARVIYNTFKETFNYNHAIIMTFAVTLAVFPTLTSKVKVVDPKYNIQFLTEWHFVIFNIGDFIGRPLASFINQYQSWAHFVVFGVYNSITRIFKPNRPALQSFNRNKVFIIFLLAFSYVRWVFLPIFLANSTCSSSSRSASQMVTDSTQNINNTSLTSNNMLLQSIALNSGKSLVNIFFLLAVLILGITNGFIASCAIVSGPNTSKNPDLAGSIMSFSVLFGLAVGSLLSFPVSSGC